MGYGWQDALVWLAASAALGYVVLKLTGLRVGSKKQRRGPDVPVERLTRRGSRAPDRE